MGLDPPTLRYHLMFNRWSPPGAPQHHHFKGFRSSVSGTNIYIFYYFPGKQMDPPPPHPLVGGWGSVRGGVLTVGTGEIWRLMNS